jgi:hypothetical protein
VPNHLKLVLSIAVAVVGATVYYFEGARGADTVQWVVAGLAGLMTRRAKGDGGGDRDAHPESAQR